MLTFTRAPTVAAGGKITSLQLYKFARAFNDRLRSGLADGTWRIHFWFLNLWRQIRNPNFSTVDVPLAGAWPSQAEALEFYIHLDPEEGISEWPVTGPGEPEGLNLGNCLAAF